MVNSSNPEELKHKIQEVFSDEAFAKELLQMEDAGDVQKALEEKVIELSLDQINRIKERTIKIQNGEVSQEQPEDMADGELSEDALLDVAGGEGWTYTDVERWFESW